MENQDEKAQTPEIKNTTADLLAKSAALKKKNDVTLEKLHALKAQSDALLKPDKEPGSKP